MQNPDRVAQRRDWPIWILPSWWLDRPTGGFAPPRDRRCRKTWWPTKRTQPRTSGTSSANARMSASRWHTSADAVTVGVIPMRSAAGRRARVQGHDGANRRPTAELAISDRGRTTNSVKHSRNAGFGGILAPKTGVSCLSFPVCAEFRSPSCRFAPWRLWDWTRKQSVMWF